MKTKKKITAMLSALVLGSSLLFCTKVNALTPIQSASMIGSAYAYGSCSFTQTSAMGTTTHVINTLKTVKVIGTYYQQTKHKNYMVQGLEYAAYTDPYVNGNVPLPVTGKQFVGSRAIHYVTDLGVSWSSNNISSIGTQSYETE